MRKTPKNIGPADASADNGRKNRTLGVGVLTPNQRVVLSLYRRDGKDSGKLSARARLKGL